MKKDRDARALAGLSMGEAESLHTGLNHLDEFAWIGGFSSGGMLQNFDEEFPAVGSSGNPPLRLLWVACGKDNVWTNLNRDFNQWLNSKSIQHTYTTPGRHTWLVCGGKTWLTSRRCCFVSRGFRAVIVSPQQKFG